MKKILIPIDFSENSADALTYAAELFNRQAANFHIVYAISSDTPSPQASLLSAKFINMEYELAKDKLAEFIDSIQDFLSNHKNINISSLVLVGNKSMMIKDEANKIEADLIIMGTGGKSHSSLEKLLGTISSGVIQDANMPVILVPNGYTFKTIKNIVFATNLNHEEPFELWRVAKHIRPNSFNLHCVHVLKNEEETSEKAIAEFSKFMLKNSPSIKTKFSVEISKNIEDSITDMVIKHDAEMVIMHSSKKSLWNSFFNISHTKNMAFRTDIPLLIIDNRS